MSLSGIVRSVVGLCLLLLAATGNSAEEKSSLALNYESGAINGALIDLQYPVQDMGGAPLPMNRKDDRVIDCSESLRGEVIDLKAAGAEIKENATEVKISLQGEILFDFDKANIRPAAEPTLMQVAAIIQNIQNQMF